MRLPTRPFEGEMAYDDRWYFFGRGTTEEENVYLISLPRGTKKRAQTIDLLWKITHFWPKINRINLKFFKCHFPSCSWRRYSYSRIAFNNKWQMQNSVTHPIKSLLTSNHHHWFQLHRHLYHRVVCSRFMIRALSFLTQSQCFMNGKTAPLTRLLHIPRPEANHTYIFCLQSFKFRSHIVDSSVANIRLSRSVRNKVIPNVVACRRCCRRAASSEAVNESKTK